MSVMKVRIEMGSSWIRPDRKSNGTCPSETEEDTGIRSRRPRADRSRGWTEAATGRGSHRELGEARKDCPPRALSRDTALPTPHFGLLAFGTVRERTSGVLSHQLCGDFYGSPEKLGRDGRFHRQLVQAARCRAPAVGFPSPSSSSPMSDPSLPFLPNIEGDTGVVWGNTPVA